MNLEDAKKLALPLVGKHNCVIVASDASVYCDSDIDALKAHAIDQKLKLFMVKPTQEEIELPVKKETKSKKSEQ